MIYPWKGQVTYSTYYITHTWFIVTFYFTKWAIGLRQRITVQNVNSSQDSHCKYLRWGTMMNCWLDYNLVVAAKLDGMLRLYCWLQYMAVIWTVKADENYDHSSNKQYICSALFQFQSSDWLVLYTSFFPWIKGIPSFHILPWFLSGDDGRAQWCYQAKLHHVLNSFPSGFSTNN